jgi:uncharacterized membrane protein YdbT with pleckstrin-like domain
LKLPTAGQDKREAKAKVEAQSIGQRAKNKINEQQRNPPPKNQENCDM